MLNGAAHPELQQQVQLLTAESIHRQQRDNLMIRALDLECENVLLKQEVQRLTALLGERPAPEVYEPRAPADA
jgi:hypothetical protein